MSGRARAVLARFPAHLDAAREGKQLSIVANAIATGLDDLAASLAAVRRAHRLGHADATVDVRLHGALHGIAADDFAALDRRLARVRHVAGKLKKAVDTGDDAARGTRAEQLCDLLGIYGPAPRLALFAPPTGTSSSPDLEAGAAALLAAVSSLTSYVGRRESVRARVRAVCRIHARGNGTVRALLEAAASALDLTLDDDRASRFKDELRPAITVTRGGAAGTTRYAYVVVARSRSKNVDRQSAAVEITTGPAALSVTNYNLISWTPPPDARDFLVFRVANGADPTKIGPLTPTALDATTTSFADTGQPVLLPPLGQPATGAVTLDPEVDDALFHSGDRFWHAAFVRERVSLLPAAPAVEVIGMEENPVRREWSPAIPATNGVPPDAPRTHSELFPVYRRGFGRSLLQIHVTGMENRTIGPMLVNRDEGRGIGFAGIVPDGAVLVFDEEGRVTLDDTDVTASAFAWEGACFASNDDDPAAPRDFVFDGPGVAPERRAVFAVATPFDALDGGFTFPGPGDPLPVPGVGVGRTRFAFFVQEAHFAAVGGTGSTTPIPLSPRTHAGVFDGSVFAPPSGQQPAAGVALSWLEREAYALRILVPRRYALFDLFAPPGEPPMSELVRRAVERHRPAGVDVRVDYIDDHWILGTSEVTGATTTDPILSLRGGSVLWTSPPAPV